MDRFVQFLFKYKWSVFSRGDLHLAARPAWIIIILIALILSGLIYFLYINPKYRITQGRQAALISLRVALLALIAFLLMRPVLVVSSVIPQSTAVAIVADSSKSMELGDENKMSRIDALKATLDGSFTKALDARFKVRMHKFADSVEGVHSTGELAATGPATDISRALSEASKDSGGLPLSAIVLMSDGGANTTADLTATLRELRTANIPVYSVGYGSTKSFKDAEIVRIGAPKRVLVGSAVNAEVLLKVSGFGDSAKAILAISEDGKAIKTENVDIRAGDAQTVNIEFTPAAAGVHRYTFEIKPLDGELTLENNAQESLIEITDTHPKVLYIEGEPRWEYGKMRSSLGRNEKNLILVSVLRSADGKFYRQGVESGQELDQGFPRTEEELFSYQGFILGSLEANFFTYDQLKMIEQFVARRGAGFLALGGARSFDAGKYANTPVASMLPLDLDDRIEEPELPAVSNFKAELTARGRMHAVTRLNEDRNLSAKAWEELPPITVPEILTQVKPGATVILDARSTTDRSRTVPLLAEERYGRGRTIAFTTNDTWRWRMLLDSKNTSHETFWRQMLRYLVSSTPGPIEVATEREVYYAGDTVTIRADVNDKKFEIIKDAQVVARVTDPEGISQDLPLPFGLGENTPDYRSEFRPTKNGLYRVEIIAKQKGAELGHAISSFLRSDKSREFNDPRQNVELLRRVAAETGGKYFEASKAGDLPEELSYLEGKNSEKVSKELWDMPFNLLLLVGLAAGEWFLRKRSGLA